MRHLYLLSGLIISAPCILCAQEPEQETYQKLAAGLRAEVSVLRGIVDAASAQAALPELKRVMEELRALNDTADERQLMRYIENTPDMKQPLLDEIERLFVELQRLEKARFYQVAPLGALLRSMLIPAAA